MLELKNISFQVEDDLDNNKEKNRSISYGICP